MDKAARDAKAKADLRALEGIALKRAAELYTYAEDMTKKAHSDISPEELYDSLNDISEHLSETAEAFLVELCGWFKTHFTYAYLRA